MIPTDPIAPPTSMICMKGQNGTTNLWLREWMQSNQLENVDVGQELIKACTNNPPEHITLE
eukprot:914002-Karenia_brevis.AAC.1